MENAANIANALVTPKGPPPVPLKDTGTDMMSEVSAALDNTFAVDADARKLAEKNLHNLSMRAGFAPALLDLIADSTAANDSSRKLAAAAYLKNICKGSGWTHNIVDEDKTLTRRTLLGLLVGSTELHPDLLNMLVECFRLVCNRDFPDNWPTVVEELENEKSESRRWFLSVHALAKRFEYFQNPTMVEVSAPASLESICERLLVPALKEVKLSGNAPDRVMLKTLFRVTRSYFPSSLRPHLDTICDLLTGVLKTQSLQQDPEVHRNQKRALTMISSLLVRHESLMKTHAGDLLSTVVEWLNCETTPERLKAAEMSGSLERLESIALGLLMECTEGEVTNELIDWSSVFRHGNKSKITDNLSYKHEQDAELWLEDPDEYLWKTLDFENEAQEEMEHSADIQSIRKAAIGLIRARHGVDINTTMLETVGEFGKFLLYGSLFSLQLLDDEVENDDSAEQRTIAEKGLEETVEFLKTKCDTEPLEGDQGSSDWQPTEAMLVVNALWAASQCPVDVLEEKNVLETVLKSFTWFLKCGGSDSLKPVRLASAYGLCTLLESAQEFEVFTESQIQYILEACIAIGNEMAISGNEEINDISGLEYVLTAKVLESPQLPLPKNSLIKLAEHLQSRCLCELQVDQDENLSDSRTLACFGSIASRLLAEDLFDDENSTVVSDTWQPVCETVANCTTELLTKLWSRERLLACASSEEEELIPYSPECTAIVAFLCQTKSLQKNTEKLSHVRSAFLSLLGSWASTLAMLDGEWEQVLVVLRAIDLQIDDGSWCGSVVELCDHFLVGDGSFKCSRVACQYLLAMFNSQSPKVLMSDESLLSQVCTATFARLLNGTESSALKSSLVLVLCHCYVASPSVANSSMNEQGVLDDFLRCYIDVVPFVVGPISSKIVILAGISLLDQLQAEQETAASRRLLGQALDKIVHKVLDIQSGEIERQRNEHLEALCESEEEESEEEEVEDAEEETEQEFRERYAAIAQDLEDQRSQDSDSDEAAEAEMLVDHGDHDGFQDVNVVEQFVNWYKKHGDVVDANLKRTSKATFDELVQELEK